MAHRSFLAVAFAGFGLLGCGAGDSASAGGPVLDQSPSTNPNQPVSGTQQPAINPDQPSPNPNGPSGSGSVGGTPGAICDAICNEVIDCLGLRGQPGVQEGLAECSADCSQDIEVPPACATQVDAYVDCLLGSGLICQIVQEDENLDLDAAQTCVAEAGAVEACAPDPDPPAECVAPACSCAGDPCLQCLCLNSQDLTLCTDDCAASN